MGFVLIATAGVLIVCIAWVACRVTAVRLRSICDNCKNVCVDSPDCEVGKEIRERENS